MEINIEESVLDNLPENWVTNNDDSDPDCETNDSDYCEVCAGDGSTCGDCDGINGAVTLNDECGECGGGGIIEGFCDCLVT